MIDDGTYARPFLYSDHYMYFPPSIPAHHILIIVFTTDALSTPFLYPSFPGGTPHMPSTILHQNLTSLLIRLLLTSPSLYLVCSLYISAHLSRLLLQFRENPTIRLLLVYRYASCLDTSTHVNGLRIQRVEELSNCARSPSTATRTFIFHSLHLLYILYSYFPLVRLLE